jgi:hypothetical protein
MHTFKVKECNGIAWGMNFKLQFALLIAYLCLDMTNSGGIIL